MQTLRGNKAVKELRGRGLMIGIQLQPGWESLRDDLLNKKHIFTGGAGADVIRLLPPLTIGQAEIERFAEAFIDLTK